MKNYLEAYRNAKRAGNDFEAHVNLIAYQDGTKAGKSTRMVAWVEGQQGFADREAKLHGIAQN